MCVKRLHGDLKNPEQKLCDLVVRLRFTIPILHSVEGSIMERLDIALESLRL